MQKITPFLWFDDQAEEAMNLYASIFKNGKIESISRFGDDVPGPKGKVLTGSFQLAGQEFNALNGGPQYQFTPANSFFVVCQNEQEIDALWQKLSEGGTVLMELDRYPFSEKFGWLNDRYGLSWQLNQTGDPQKITPFLMFVGDQTGRAEEAIQFYTSVFQDSKMIHVQHYGPDMAEPAGSVQHASFNLAGENFMAMDGGRNHAFTFTPAVSYFVNCETQEDVDYFWEKLSEGGEKGPCGWLTDKFGVSWQVVPSILGVLINDPDPEKAHRVTQAMLQMGKIDIAGLKRAYEQV